MKRRLFLAWSVVLASAGTLRAEDSPIAPERAAQRMKLPEGFRVHLVAGEPRLIKPMAMTTDDSGRLLTKSSQPLQWKR
jgi:hypothetical protein